jgi:large subunit ribosomal protein L13
MKTYVPKQGDIQREWWVVDASGMTLGASRPSSLLIGRKHKPVYTTYEDTGDHVVVVNAEKIKLSVAS